jgi:hypothetical protein
MKTFEAIPCALVLLVVVSTAGCVGTDDARPQDAGADTLDPTSSSAPTLGSLDTRPGSEPSIPTTNILEDTSRLRSYRYSTVDVQLTYLLSRLKSGGAADDLRAWAKSAFELLDSTSPDSVSELPPVPASVQEAWRAAGMFSDCPHIGTHLRDWITLWEGGGFGVYGIVVAKSADTPVPDHIPEHLRCGPDIWAFGARGGRRY